MDRRRPIGRCRRAGQGRPAWRSGFTSTWLSELLSGGADVWASPGDYAPGISLGAPPDAFAADGQRWGLLPLNTVALRRQRFRPFIDLLRAAMRHAGIIRIDHVLGLARGFWLPDGSARCLCPLSAARSVGNRRDRVSSGQLPGDRRGSRQCSRRLARRAFRTWRAWLPVDLFRTLGKR